MGNKQILAQIGVLLLVGVNVAAYYVFWPHQGGAKSEGVTVPAEPEFVAVPTPPPEKASPPASVKELPVAPVAPPLEPAKLNLPVADVVAAVVNEPSSADPLSKLLEHIQKENGTMPGMSSPDKNKAPIVPAPPLEEKKYVIPAKAEDPAGKNAPSNPPLPLPPLKVFDDIRDNKDAAIAPALAPKVRPSPWLVHMETIGNQTRVIARLRHPSSAKLAAEFKILCDRIEVKAPGGDVQALGKVTFHGAGIKGTCQRLTVPLYETQLWFETQVQIAPESPGGASLPGSSLRGDRIVWDLSAPADGAASPILPLGGNLPSQPNPASLGAPK